MHVCRHPRGLQRAVGSRSVMIARAVRHLMIRVADLGSAGRRLRQAWFGRSVVLATGSSRSDADEDRRIGSELSVPRCRGRGQWPGFVRRWVSVHGARLPQERPPGPRGLVQRTRHLDAGCSGDGLWLVRHAHVQRRDGEGGRQAWLQVTRGRGPSTQTRGPVGGRGWRAEPRSRGGPTAVRGRSRARHPQWVLVLLRRCVSSFGAEVTSGARRAGGVRADQPPLPRRS